MSFYRRELWWRWNLGDGDDIVVIVQPCGRKEKRRQILVHSGVGNEKLHTPNHVSPCDGYKLDLLDEWPCEPRLVGGDKGQICTTWYALGISQEIRVAWLSSREELPNYLHRCINIECLWYHLYSIRVLPEAAACLFRFPSATLSISPLYQFHATNDTFLSSSLPTFNLQIPILSLLGHPLSPLACQHSLSKSTDCCINKVASEPFHVLVFCRLLPRPTQRESPATNWTSSALFNANRSYWINNTSALLTEPQGDRTGLQVPHCTVLQSN